MKNLLLPYALVVSVTNRGKNYLKNIANNYLRQTYPLKRLCVILNSPLEKKEAEEILLEKEIKDYFLISLPTASLGECLNKSIDTLFCLETFQVWTKMDDDDYYGKNYLMNHVKIMFEKKADIVGRRDMYVYVPEWKKMFFLKNGGHNGWVTWVQGASLTVAKKVFKKLKFLEINKGEDTAFGKNATKLKFKTYAAFFSDYVVIRHEKNEFHTWKIKNLSNFLRQSILMKPSVTQQFENENHLFYET
jgi:hypothetical protein